MATEAPLVPRHARWSLPADYQTTNEAPLTLTRTHSKSISKNDVSLPELPLFVEARSHALAEPGKAAVIDKTRSQSFTYSQLLNDVASFKAQIEQYLPSNQTEEPRVAFLTPAGYDYVVMKWAIWAAGAISVPLCTSHPLKELQYTISDSDPSLIILHPSFSRFEAGLQEQAPTIPLITITPFSQTPSHTTTLPKFTTAFPLSRRALIIYTSGTTSRPKGCVTTHETITFQARCLVEAWKYTRSDHLIHVLPLHHVHGIINGLTATLLAGGTVEMHAKFDAKTVWDRWIERGSTMFMAVPTVYSRLIDYFDSNIRGTDSESAAREGANALRLVVSGSAALPVSVKRKFDEITGHELLERYGMTEIGMGLSCGLEREKRIDGSVGWPLPGVQVRLTDPETHSVISSSGDELSGNIEIKGPNLLAEYFRQPKATAETFTQDGWFKTGDVAKRDASGAYFIQGRESVDIIKSGGYKISALEVERKVLGNVVLGDVVREVVVVGVADAEWGQRVAAVVTLRNQEREIDLKMFRAPLKEDMAPYKIPSILKVVDAIERNAMGKVNKKQILKQYFA
ncbi:hypothetical protein PV11_00942 [Exophiala sideris]|uniref:AMP-dependent synthetase/ligase domain-containing protein n=1 Tax=Exophiala sideris TaxID=1016849 RepID=A0A0D1YUL0_9EURO|nr:hypothetical protein PV11_00942 [Exophiala sideris]